jgi:hypothetical protein
MGVNKITDAEKPTFDAAVYSDRLQETRLAAGPLPAVQVFDKTKPASIVPLAQYVKGKLTDKVNELCQFTNDIKNDLDSWRSNKVNPELADHEQRITALESQSSPFPG